VSLPGLTGQPSIPGRWLLDRPVKPGDDTQSGANLIGKRSKRLDEEHRCSKPK